MTWLIISGRKWSSNINFILLVVSSYIFSQFNWLRVLDLVKCVSFSGKDHFNLFSPCCKHDCFETLELVGTIGFVLSA